MPNPDDAQGASDSAPDSSERPSTPPPASPPEGKPGDQHRGAAADGGELAGPDTFGGYDDDMGRGAD